MIRRPPRSTQSRSSAASDVYKRQVYVTIIASCKGGTFFETQCIHIYSDLDGTWHGGGPQSIGHIVLDGDPGPPPPKRDTAPPIFNPCLLWPNGWMDQDATWYEGRPRPVSHYVRRGPSSTSRKGHSSPLFGSCLLWPRSPISATAEFLCIMSILSILSTCLLYTSPSPRD